MSVVVTDHTSAMAAFVAELTYDDVPPEVLAAANRSLLDFLSCTAYGSTRPISQKARAAAGVGGALGANAGCTVIGTDQRASAIEAAYLNAVATSAGPLLEDYSNESLGHPSSGVIPAVIAAGELSGATWSDVVLGTVVGYEVAVRVGAAVGTSGYERGWHPRGGPNAFGAAVGAAKLLGRRQPEDFAQVMGLAGSQAGGLVAGGYFSDGFYTLCAGAAAAGVRGALLLDAGFSGNGMLLEDSTYGGYLGLVSDDPAPEKLSQDLGSVFQITRVSAKLHPITGAAHAVMEAAVRVAVENDIAVEDIAEVYVDGFSQMAHQLNTKHPRSSLHAGLSIPYIVAVSLSDRELWLDQVAEGRLAEPALAALQDRISVRCDPEIDSRSPERLGARVTVLMKNGDEFSVHVPEAPGDHRRPLTTEQIEDKSVRLLQTMMSRTNAESAVRSIGGLGAAVPLADVLPRFSSVGGAKP